MGLFSKIMKDVAEAAADKKWEDAVEKVRSSEKIKDLSAKVRAGVDVLESELSARSERQAGAADAADIKPAVTQAGDSFGPTMPEEDNQYLHEGPFWTYFEDIFTAEFSDLRFEKEEVKPSKFIVYNFYSGDTRVLMVELLSKNFTMIKLRDSYEGSGVPYVRFYIDHRGWWNTRSYVIRRIREAMIL